MTGVVDLWISTAYKPAFRCGGWAVIRPDQGGLFAVAGGLRRAAGEEILLKGLLAGLADLKARVPTDGETVRLRLGPRERKDYAGFLARLAGKGAAEEPPLDPSFREAVLNALNTRGLRLGPPLQAHDPAAAFLTAWADLAREKATSSGAFSAPIPKANLAKVASHLTA